MNAQIWEVWYTQMERQREGHGFVLTDGGQLSEVCAALARENYCDPNLIELHKATWLGEAINHYQPQTNRSEL